jgi:hypothetical protein
MRVLYRTSIIIGTTSLIEIMSLTWKSDMSIKHSCDDVEERESIVVKQIKNVSVYMKNMDCIVV